MNTENLNWDGMADAPTMPVGYLDHPFVGDSLPCGATVIAWNRNEYSQLDGYVLAYVLKGLNGHEYVTWRYYMEYTESGYVPITLQGNYFGNILAAAKDFARRIGSDTE